MKMNTKLTTAVAAMALTGLCAGSAYAQCDFNSAPAKGLKGSMVRNYAPCPGTEHPTSNTQTEGGTEGCTPVTPYQANTGNGTLYTYDVKGKCDASTSAKLVADCSLLTDSAGGPLNLQSGPCHVTYVSSKCSGILGTDGTTPIGAGDIGFSLATLTRATFNDATNGDMTIIDFPVTFTYSTPSKGKMSLKSSSAEALVPLVGVNNADLPACTSLEIVDLTIKDPAGLPFAKLGGATRP